MRIIARFKKGEALRFVSHLDVQRLFQRAFRRADIPLAYSQGFNPHPLLAFATALAVGYTSEAEWLDIKLERRIEPAEFADTVNKSLPSGFKLLETLEAPIGLPALTKLMCAARYELSIDGGISINLLNATVKKLFQGNIIVEKRTKSGMKWVDIRPLVLSAEVVEPHAIKILGILNASEGLNVELLMKAVMKEYGEDFTYFTHRKCIYSRDGLIMPKLTDSFGVLL